MIYTKLLALNNLQIRIKNDKQKIRQYYKIQKQQKTRKHTNKHLHRLTTHIYLDTKFTLIPNVLYFQVTYFQRCHTQTKLLLL